MPALQSMMVVDCFTRSKKKRHGLKMMLSMSTNTGTNKSVMNTMILNTHRYFLRKFTAAFILFVLK